MRPVRKATRAMPTELGRRQILDPELVEFTGSRICRAPRELGITQMLSHLTSTPFAAIAEARIGTGYRALAYF